MIDNENIHIIIILKKYQTTKQKYLKDVINILVE